MKPSSHGLFIKNLYYMGNSLEYERGRFRIKIAELTNTILRDQTLDALRQEVEDIYVNEIKAEINSFKRGLTESMIR